MTFTQRAWRINLLMLSDLSFRYDFTCSNMNDDNLSKMNAERIPDVVSIGAAWFCECKLYAILKFIVNTPLNIRVHVSDMGMVFPNNGLSVLSLNGCL